MRNVSIVLVLGIFGCNSDLESDYTLYLNPLYPYNQNPFDGQPNGSLLITDAGGNVDTEVIGQLKSGTVELEHMPPLESAHLGLLLYEDQDEIGEFSAFGQTGPFSLSTGKETLETNIFISNFMSLGELGELQEPRLGAASVLTSTGKTYLFGGSSSPQATQASSEILVMSPLDDGDWEFHLVGEIKDSDGTPVPLVGAKAVTVNVDGKEHIYVVGGSAHMRNLSLSLPLGFLFDPEIEEIVWWPSKDSQTPFYYKYQPYVALLGNGSVLSVSANYQPNGDGWFIPSNSSASAEVFDPETKTYTHREPLLGHPFGGFSAAEVPFEGHLLCGGGVWTQPDNVGTLSPSQSCRLLKDDLSREIWSDLPKPDDGAGIAFHAMVQLHDEFNTILLTGGVTGTSTNSTTASAVSYAWILKNPSKNAEWEAVGSLNISRAAHAMVATPDGGAVVFGGADRMGPGYPIDFASIDCAEKYDPVNLTFELIQPCEPSGSGPYPVYAKHPDHEMILLGNYLMTSAGGLYSVLPVEEPKNLDWTTLEK